MSSVHDLLKLLQTIGYGLRGATMPNHRKSATTLERSASLFSVCNQGVTDSREDGLSFSLIFEAI